MIIRLAFITIFVWAILRLIQFGRLSFDLASLVLFFIVGLFAISFSPFLVESIANIFDFGSPGVAFVALIVVGLTILCLILSVSLSDQKRAQANLVRSIARIELVLRNSMPKN